MAQLEGLRRNRSCRGRDRLRSSRSRAAAVLLSIALFVLPFPARAGRSEACVGDCDGTGQVTVNELITGVNIALGNLTIDPCPAVDADGDGQVAINELVTAVGNALGGCPPPATPTPTATPLVPPQELAGASLTGFVFQVNPVVIVPRPDAAPDGAVPVAGADLRIVDQARETAATGATGADGGFRFDDLPPGLLRLEVRLDPESAEPDVSPFFTSIPGADILLNESFPVSRLQAAEALLASVPETALVAGPLSPLQPGTIVFPATGDLQGNPPQHPTRTIGSTAEWFFYIDPAPDAAFAHAVEYAFVDVETGAIVRESDLFWWPSINFAHFFLPQTLLLYPDEAGTLALMDHFLQTAQFPDEITVIGSPEIVQVPAALEDDSSPGISPRAADDPSIDVPWEELRQAIASVESPQDLFGFVVVGSREPWLMRSGGQMLNWLLENGVPPENIGGAIPGQPPTGFSALLPTEMLFAAIGKFTPDGYAEEIRRRFGLLDEKIQQRREEGGKPVILSISVSHGNPNGEILLFDNLIVAAHLRIKDAIAGTGSFYRPIDEVIPVQETSACGARIMVTACFANSHLERYRTRFEEAPANDVDLEIYTASGNSTASGRTFLAEISDFLYAFSLNFLTELGIPQEVDLATQLSLAEDVGTNFTKSWPRFMSLSPDGTITNTMPDRFPFNAAPLTARNSRRFFSRPGDRCPDPTFTDTPARSFTRTPTPEATDTAVATATPTATLPPSPTRTPPPTATMTLRPTETPASSATDTPTPVPTSTETTTPTATPTSSPTETATEPPTSTHTATPIETPAGPVRVKILSGTVVNGEAKPIQFFGTPIITPLGFVLVSAGVGESTFDLTQVLLRLNDVANGSTPSTSLPRGATPPVAVLVEQGEPLPGSSAVVQGIGDVVSGENGDFALLTTDMGRSVVHLSSSGSITPILGAGASGEPASFDPRTFVVNGGHLVADAVEGADMAVVSLDLSSSSITPVIATGDAFAGGTVTEVFSLDPVFLNDANAGTARIAVDDTTDIIIGYDPGAGIPAIRLREGDPAPGFADGANISRLRSSAPINAGGFITLRARVFGAGVSGDVVYVLDANGQVAGMVQEDTQVPDAPAGTIFTLLGGGSAMGSTGTPFLHRQVLGESSPRGLGFITTGGSYRTIARAGTPAPGGGTFSELSFSYAMNDAGLLLFRGEHEGGAAAYYAVDTTDPGATPTRVIGTGDTAPLPGGGTATITFLDNIPVTGGQGGDPTALNETQFTVRANLDTGETAILLIDLPDS